MKQYQQALKEVLENGKIKTDRTGVGTRSIFGYQMRFNLQDGFPAVTTKKLAWRAVVSELLWFIEGSDDERRLAEILHGTRDPAKRTIWTENANAQGKDLGYTNTDEVKLLGPVYGVQWKRWTKYTERKDMGLAHGGGVRVAADRTEVDQLSALIEGIKTNPDSRRHILSAWNVADIDKMALPPCHVLSQFDVTDGKLSCHLYQRSQDVFLGAPFNIASYALLTHMIAQVCNLEVGDFILSSGDTHIYSTHVEQVTEQLTREPMPLPTIWLNPEITDINKFTMQDIKLINYQSHGAIPAPMAV